MIDNFIYYSPYLFVVQLVPKMHIELRMIFSQLLKKQLSAFNLLFLNFTQMRRAIHPFSFNDDIQFLASIGFLDHIHEVGTIRITGNSRYRDTSSGNFAKNNYLLNVRL